ncbi:MULTISPECIES: DUF885 domain-containing protein [unclassified Colwellia]|uniref:DUF885 domain-containing protein n=1 Tax=unclassified Colwellia TaxID=196834 RepID=UPI0015F625D9|nr:MULTISPECIES: DUF885 domain-containing protein [unclassified Colwellia]MBA6233196.1 DUF885 domain-containing protein [Colwellia sp. MB02u-7]MBA6236286.1 DUF885 domain-containing protein [Colwellia sp. MB02u-11]MBA6256824.1 DUF885 domain-containing protein [Colwellia sp. MB3u-28]MBA6261170.1 DUF885 domain-containing protein [Colwellia sp. MB3u-41]MBA6298314.1 DUF885 domain-containing protein [Colwellia sp. MB3u-22]
MNFSLGQLLVVPAIIITLSACQIASNNAASTQNTANKKFDAAVQQLLNHRSSKGLYKQDNVENEVEKKENLWPDLSPQALEKKYQERLVIASVFEAINQDALSDDNQINYSIIKAQLDNNIANYHFKSHYMPFKSESGFHSNLNFVINNTKFRTEKDIELYLNKLSALPEYFDQNIYWMQQGLATGITQPQAVLVGYEQSILAFIPEHIKDSEFLKPFTTASNLINAKVLEDKKQQLIIILEAQVIPAYQGYYEFFTQEYFPNARKSIGVSETPNGNEFYSNRVKHYTTTDMTPEQIHALGLNEVKRIRKEMAEIIAKTGFEGSFTEFTHFLRTDPQFYAKTPLALIKEASYIAKQMDAKLPTLFKHLPRSPYGVAPVPESIAPKYTTGRYIRAQNDSQPGYYWVNTYALDKRPLYVLPALTLHEGVPGHHLQISLNSELDNLPSYRQNAYISAFGEGWGLYAEWLGIEAGIYKDHYSNFGRLTYEMWRAARLVVDTGMHVKGWSRERAINFMTDNTALSTHNVTTEIDRYISWAGQALSYKIGEITIRNLRKKTEAKLGKNFDVREFHHQILKNGSVPLQVLEDQINAYIKATLVMFAEK